MNRCLLGTMAWLAGMAFLAAGARAEDEIRLANGKSVKGIIKEENPTGIVYLAGKKTEKVAAQDIAEILYQVPQELRLDYRASANLEREATQTNREDKRKKLNQDALQKYKDLLPKLAENKFAQRNAQFKAAQLQVRMVEDDPGLRSAAVEALIKFKTDHPDSWQLLACVKLLASLHEQAAETAEVQKLYQEMAGRKDLDAGVRHEFGLLEARMLLRTNQLTAAKTKLLELAKGLDKKDPLALRLEVYLAACDSSADLSVGLENHLQGIVQGSADNDIKALASNALADAYLRANRPEDAFWQYLRVDVVYFQDRDEHAKALYQLSKLFDQVKKDPLRAGQCLDRLANDKEFATSEYQKKALKERKPDTKKP